VNAAVAFVGAHCSDEFACAAVENLLLTDLKKHLSTLQCDPQLAQAILAESPQSKDILRGLISARSLKTPEGTALRSLTKWFCPDNWEDAGIEDPSEMDLHSPRRREGHGSVVRTGTKHAGELVVTTAPRTVKQRRLRKNSSVRTIV
jgi:hypothetical protein